MGLGGALARPRRLFGVLLWYVLLTAGLYVVWIVLDPPAGGEARFALVPLILTQQVFVFVRCLVKVGYYAGISEALTRTTVARVLLRRGRRAGRRLRGDGCSTTPLSTDRPAASSRTRKRKGRRRNTPFASICQGPANQGRKRRSSQMISVPPSASDRTTARGKRAKRRYASTSARARAAASAAEGGGWGNVWIFTRAIGG